MTLYVCFNTISFGAHGCADAYDALNNAGHDPRINKVHGIGWLPKPFWDTKGRRKVVELSGNHYVPILVLDDGTVIDGSQEILTWAKQNLVI